MWSESAIGSKFVLLNWGESVNHQTFYFQKVSYSNTFAQIQSKESIQKMIADYSQVLEILAFLALVYFIRTVIFLV